MQARTHPAQQHNFGPFPSCQGSCWITALHLGILLANHRRAASMSAPTAQILCDICRINTASHRCSICGKNSCDRCIATTTTAQSFIRGSTGDTEKGLAERLVESLRYASGVCPNPTCNRTELDALPANEDCWLDGPRGAGGGAEDARSGFRRPWHRSRTPPGTRFWK
jgi:hypothetical protein